ncbi:hypothetical protein HNY73_007299 [Argiope bruennichi]|uniref:Uncharacterized protein n=1 Tax=Argiope bruennichi TaxID=94029 RepID=A0A8T0FGK5_ARGBR|nr:hypothetical protein HNY73_007299 [Argiope bruennichi]
MDEDIVPQPFKRSNSDYMETCEEEVNDVLPRLQRLSIKDDETMYLPSDSGDILCLSPDTIISPINTVEENLIADSNEKACPVFVNNVSSNLSVDEATVVATDNRKSLHGTVRTQQNFSTDMVVDIRSQDVLQKTLADDEIKRYLVHRKKRQALDETKEDAEVGVLGEKPMDLSLKHNMKYLNEAGHSIIILENKVAPEEMKHGDPETGEVSETLSNISLENSDLEQHAGETASDITFNFDSSKLSYFADESSDDQSNRSSGIMMDSPPCSHNAGAMSAAAGKCSRKIAVFVPPIAGMSEIRQRRFGIFQQQSANTDATVAPKANSSSDEDSVTPRFIRRVSPMNSKLGRRKTVKTSPISRTLNPSVFKNDEEKRPSPCKRKKVSSENLDETAGKFRKRSISEHNAETGEKTRLAIRSRSLSPRLKNGQHAFRNRQLSEVSIIPQSWKRTSSESLNVDCVKYRKPSISSD